MDSDGPFVQQRSLLQHQSSLRIQTGHVFDIDSSNSEAGNAPALRGQRSVLMQCRRVMRFSMSGSRWPCLIFSCCVGVCVCVLLTPFALGPLRSTSPRGLRITHCPSAYFTASACMLGGQDYQQLMSNRSAWAVLLSAFTPGSPLKTELQSFLESDSFQSGSRCPRWLGWNESSRTCYDTSRQQNRTCESDELLDAKAAAMGIDCTGNVYKRINGNTWGGVCTCPGGASYEVGDGNDGCLSISCFGGSGGLCGPRVIAEDRRGMMAICMPDFSKGAELMGRANPSIDVDCWGEGTGTGPPRYMANGFAQQAIAKPLVHFPRAAWINVMLQTEAFSFNKHPIVGSFGDFEQFYGVFYSTRAGDICRARYGNQVQGRG